MIFPVIQMAKKKKKKKKKNDRPVQSLFYDNANITVMLLFRGSCTIIIMLSSVVGVWNMSKSLLWCVWDCLYEPRHDKTNKMAMRLAKTQNSLGMRPVWSESSLCAQWVAKDPSFRRADSEDSDQTGRMPRLIWVFAGRTLILFVLSCRGSYVFFGTTACTHTSSFKVLSPLFCLLFAEKISYEEFEQVMKEEVLSKADPQFDLLEAFRFALVLV